MTNNIKKKNANGEGSVFYDESRKRWRCQISYKTPNGTTKRKSFSGKTITEVRKLKNKFILELNVNGVTDESNVTLVDLLKEESEYDYKINAIRASAYTRRLDTIKIIEKSNLKNIPIRKITKTNIDEFLCFIKMNYSNSVISKLYGSISRAYRLAIFKKIISVNLLDSPFIKKPSADKPTKKVYAFTIEEQNTFLRALSERRLNKNSIDYTPMFYIELFAGLRMGEICALRPSDIDLKNRLINVNRTTTRGINFEVTISNVTKTENGKRTVPIQPCLISVLEKAINCYKPNPDGLLFYNFKMNRPITSQQVNDSFKRLCQKYDINTSGGQHLLRHTFATRCIEASVPATVLKKWMGHSDISITLNTYCDVFDRMDNNAMEQFSNYCQDNLAI